MLTFFTLAFFLALPFFDLCLFKRHLAEQRHRDHKPTYYAQLLCELWLPTGAVFVLAAAGVIHLADLGLDWPKLEMSLMSGWVSIGITILAGLFIVYALIDLFRLKYNAPYRDSVKSKLQSVKVPEYMGLLMPSTGREKTLYRLVAISAGITEEILYRGFISAALLTSFPDLSIWLIMIISSLLFGLGHLYQGVGGMLRTFILGMILSLIYLATHSLLLCMLIHILIDLTGSLLETLEDSEPRLSAANAIN